MTSELILTNARVVLGEEVADATVVVRGGRIAAVDPGRTGVAAAEDLETDYLLPGFVELHTDNLERHLQPRPGARWPVMPALLAHDAQVAAAGITTVFDALAIGGSLQDEFRTEILAASAEAIRSAREGGRLRADHWLHMRCEVSHPQLPALLAPFAEDPLVRLMSLMDHTPGQRQFVDLEKHKTYYTGRYGIGPAELEALVAKKQALAAQHSERHRRHVVALCRERGLVMASHDDATRAHVEEAVSLGITISEFPTTMEAAAAAHQAGMSNVMGAPNVVRGGSHSGNVAATELAGAGVLDALSSDYVPASLLHAAFVLHDKVAIALPRAVDMIAGRPARDLGLADRGRIAEGLRGDLVRVAVAPDGTPWVRRTWREGSPIF